MTRSGPFGVTVVAVLMATLASCGPFAKNTLTPHKCTGDPCATLVCPDGMRCSVSGSCSPACEPMTYKTF